VTKGPPVPSLESKNRVTVQLQPEAPLFVSMPEDVVEYLAVPRKSFWNLKILQISAFHLS
jgi:hypothetical protein